MAAGRTIAGAPSYAFKNVAAGATTAVKAGSGHLHSIVINTSAAGSISLFDSLTGTGTSIGVLKASIAEGTYIYDVQFTIGLTIVSASTSDFTVSYA